MLQKHKLSDNGLQRALATFEKLGDNEVERKNKALDEARKFAADLRKDKSVLAVADAGKFLQAVEAGAAGERKRLADAAGKAQAKGAEQKLDAKVHLTIVEKAGRLADGLEAEFKQAVPDSCVKLRETVTRMRKEMDAAVQEFRSAERSGKREAVVAAWQRYSRAFAEGLRAAAALAECSNRNGAAVPKAAALVAGMAKLLAAVRNAEKELAKA
jgi:hypothetical protein